MSVNFPHKFINKGKFLFNSAKAKVCALRKLYKLLCRKEKTESKNEQYFYLQLGTGHLLCVEILY